MKTLVLQLARLGDIYQTWPVLRALKRASAEGDELHLLARERFSAAVEGLEGIDRLWTLSSQTVLGPLVAEKIEVDAALTALSELVEALRAEGFQRVINLSFSPFSSRLTGELAVAGAEARGYTRHADGYLDIADDASAYFYAQVGPGRFNRVHLTDLFALVAGVELTEEDWARPPSWSTERESEAAVRDVLSSPVRPILVHIGASQNEKSYGAYKWLQVVKGLLESTDTPVVIIGSNEERAAAQTAAAVSTQRKPIDLAGRTTLPDLFDLIAWSRLIIGADSAPVHIAALTGTPVLNLSFNAVSFWETGPKSAGSRILVYDSPQDLPSDVVVREAFSMLDGREGHANVVRVAGRLVPYEIPTSEDKTSSSWEWLQAIYMGHDFPLPENTLCAQGLMRLFEANELAFEQLETLGQRPGDATAVAILDRFDEIIETIARLVPTLGTLTRWFQTERIRLGPMPADELLQRTRALHNKLQEILQLYANAPQALDDNHGSEGHDDIRLG